MTDVTPKFGHTEAQEIADIIRKNSLRFQERDKESFPTWAELYYAFRQAKVLLDIADRVSRAIKSPGLVNVDVGNFFLRNTPAQLFIDAQTGEFMLGKISAGILRQQVILEITGYTLNAALLANGDLDKAAENNQLWAPFLYRKGLQMAMGIMPFVGMRGSESDYENAIYATVGEKIEPHLPHRTCKLLERRPANT
jgi:hypothetical protein